MMNQHDHAMHHPKTETNPNEYTRFLLVICSIVVTSNALYLLGENLETIEFVRTFMGVFMVVFAGFKFLGYRMFTQMFPSYDLIAKRLGLYAKVYPFVELLLGIGMLLDLGGFTRDMTTVVVMTIGAVGIINSLYIKKQKMHCACLGNIIKLPLSWVSLFENILMSVLAVVMLVFG